MAQSNMYFKASTPRLPSLVIQKPSDGKPVDFLALPSERQRGMITIFNRSHYEDVDCARVRQLVSEKVWRERYHTINQFEQMLTLSNIKVIKFFLHKTKTKGAWRSAARPR